MDCRHFKGTLTRITEFTGEVENIPRFVGTTHGMQITVEVVPISEITAEAESLEHTEPASAEFNPVSRKFTFGIPKGTPGQQGTTPHIGANRHWYIGDLDTGIVAEGQDGEDGDDGVTPRIGDNKHWYIGDIDTGIVAEGEDGQDGHTPFIGTNGNWWIGETDTGVRAAGEDGEDGTTPHIGSNLHWWIGTVDTGIVAQGQDGYTPVKGIDYFTPTEIEEIEEAAASKVVVPTKLSELEDDATHRTVTDTEKATWNGIKENVFVVDYNNPNWSAAKAAFDAHKLVIVWRPTYNMLYFAVRSLLANDPIYFVPIRYSADFTISSVNLGIEQPRISLETNNRWSTSGTDTRSTSILETTLVGSTTKLPTANAVKTYIDNAGFLTLETLPVWEGGLTDVN